MTDLGDRMDKILTGRDGQAAAGRPSMRELAQAMRDVFGSGRKAAKELNVNESTFRRILSGQTKEPKIETAGAFERVGRAMGSRSITNADIKLPVTQHKRDRRGGGGRRQHGRERELGAGNLGITDPKAADRIRAAYVKGGKEEAAKQLIRETTVGHYARWLVPDEWRDELAAELDSDYGYSVG